MPPPSSPPPPAPNHPSPHPQVLIVSYETFRIHAERFRGEGAVDLLICDEAHRLKNDQTLTNKVGGGRCGGAGEGGRGGEIARCVLMLGCCAAAALRLRCGWHCCFILITDEYDH